MTSAANDRIRAAHVAEVAELEVYEREKRARAMASHPSAPIIGRRAPWPHRIDPDDGAGELSPWPGAQLERAVNALSVLAGLLMAVELGRRWLFDRRPFR
jgi:hypothetical protein